MLHFPAFCIDDFYENPDEVRKFALNQEYRRIGRCQGRRTRPLNEIDINFYNNFCKKLISIFYDIDTVDVNWNIETVFHIHDITDNSNYKDLNPDDLILAHRYRDEILPEKRTSAHLDEKNLFSGVVYLNPVEEYDAGTAIYKILETRDDNKAMIIESGRFRQIYNRLAAFDGQTYHGRTGDNTKTERLTQVFFVKVLDSKLSTPLTRFKI